MGLYIIILCLSLVHIGELQQQQCSQTYDNRIDVSLNKQNCHMTSQYNDGRWGKNACSVVINGRCTTGDYLDDICVMSKDNATDRMPTWRVDLEQEYTIQRITVTSRSEYYGLPRITYTTVWVGNVTVYKYPATVPTDIKTDISRSTPGSGLPAKGRFVSLSRNENNFADDLRYNRIILTFCKLEVWVCKPGHHGENCTACGSVCTDQFCDEINNTCSGPCKSSTCLNGGTCTANYSVNYTCTCPPGVSGDHCQADKRPCTVNRTLCQNNGTCENTPNGTSYNCMCPAGYTGRNCQTNIDECSSQPCVNGTCQDKINGYSCTCSAGYEGTHCNKDINECLSNPCGNGYCNNTEGSYLCSCYPNYGGPSCTNGVGASSSLMVPAVAGSVGGVLIILVAVVIAVVILRRRKTRKAADEQDNGTLASRQENMPSTAQNDTSNGYSKLAGSSQNGPIYENVKSLQQKEVASQPVKTAPKPAKTAPQADKTAPQQGKEHSVGPASSMPRVGSSDTLGINDDAEDNLYTCADLYACYSTTKESESVLDSFQKHLLERLSSQDTIAAEFQEFPRAMLYPHEVGIEPKNNRKNRFKKLCAYDKNRVVLQRPENDPDTDYINASWIKGPTSDRAYIAAQGPRLNSVPDLWWMVWQEHVTQVVMLTNCVEDGKDKCDEYWPTLGKTMTFGHVTVASQTEEHRTDFTIRTFLLNLQGDKSSQRKVCQYHYQAWFDHGVPEPGSLANFWRYVTTRAERGSTPVVHCSAGVGRTGTYIALDIAMGRKSRGDDVNVFDIVMELREQRSIMVQTLAQYKFLHEVVLETYTSRNSRLTAEQLDLRFPTDIDVTKPNDIIDKEFTLLTEMKKWAQTHHANGQLAENKDKNRNSHVLPDDDHVAYLSVPVDGRNDYINAVFLPSFWRRRGLLLTQLPLPHTLVDLWRLVEGCDITTILSLGAKDDDQTVKNFCQYWPLKAGEELTIGPFSLHLKSCNVINANVVSYKILMSHKDKKHTVKIVHYTDWSGKVPGNISDVIYLVNLVRAASEDSHVPVLIQCLDGASKSGLFAVLCDVMSRLTEDGEVDAFCPVRHVQSVRKDAVTSEEQYRYCYKVALQIHRSQSVYANT